MEYNKKKFYYILQNLYSVDHFVELNPDDRVVMVLMVNYILESTKNDYPYTYICCTITSESHECMDLIKILKIITANIKLDLFDKLDLLINLYIDLTEYRNLKCISNNYRTINNQSYYNMMSRIIYRLDNYFKDHSIQDYIDKKVNLPVILDFNSKMDKGYKNNRIVQSDIICDFCGSKMKNIYDQLLECEKCSNCIEK